MRKNYHFSMLKLWRIATLLVFGFSISVQQNVTAQVSGYVFNQNSGTYVPLTSANVVVTGASSMDSYVSPGITIPSFTLDGISYTTAYMSSNGFLNLGGSSPSTYTNTPISSNTGSGITIAAMACDLNKVGTSSEMRWKDLTNEIVFEWYQFERYNVTEVFDFQIRLNKSNGDITMVYNLVSGPGSSTSYQPQVGIRTSSTDYNSITVGTGSETWASPSASTNNSNKCRFTSSSPAKNFTSGQTYTFTPPSCISPNTLSVSGITATVANLNWLASASSPSGGYDYYYSLTNTAPTTGTTPSGNVSGLSAPLTGLTANTSYYYWVRANCGGGDESSWVSGGLFTTPQIAATLPYLQDFNSSNDFGFVNGTEDNQWAYGSATGNTGSSIYISEDNGTTNTYNNSSSSIVQAYRDIAIPSGTTMASLSFDWKANGESGYDYLRVWLAPSSYTPNAGSQISSGNGKIQLGANYGLETTWQTYNNSALDVSSFANTTMRLIFEWKNDGSGGLQDPIGIDNVSLTVPSCVAPIIAASTAVAATTATINWTAPSTAPSAGYNYEVRTSGTAGSGATGLFIASTSTAGTVSENLTGLSPTTTYFVYVQSNCGGGDLSAWVSGGSFTTPCSSVSSFTENFDAVTTPNLPNCWSELIDGGASSSANVNTTTSNSNSSPNCVALTNSYSPSAASNIILVSPILSNLSAGTHRIRFSGRNSTASQDIIIGTISDPADGSTFTPLDTIDLSTTYAEYSFHFDTYSGTDNYIGFRRFSTSTYTTVYLDDITWEVIPTCLVPSALTSSGITSSGTTISWTASPSSPSSYDYFYNTTNTAPIAGTTPSGNVSGAVTASITGLTANTSYYYWVRANCGGGDFSTWVSGSTFYTGHCLPSASNTSTYISDFTTTGGITNISNASGAIGSGGYSDNYATHTLTASANGTVSFTTTVVGNTVGMAIWVDLNNNLVFESAERLYVGTGYATDPSGSFTIPTTATIGDYRMRILVDYNSNIPSNPCGFGSGRGEVEDYKLSVVAPPTWNGSISADWNTASNWTPSAVPAASAVVVIPSGTPNEPSITNLTVTGYLVLASGANLTVSGILTNDGVITIESGATLVQTTGSTTAGTGIYEVEQDVIGNGTASSTTGRFYYMASPVPATTTSEFGSGTSRSWSYDEPTQSFTEVTSSPVAMSPGSGYGVIFDGNATISFEDFGINNGNVTTGPLTRTGTAGTKEGFNLVGNPFPSYLNWDDVTLSNVNPTIWFQTKDGSGNKVFDMYNSTSGIATSNSGSLTNEFVAPMQAFWIEVPALGTTSLTFDNSMRSHQAVGSGLKFDINNFDALVRMNLTDESSSDEAVIFFHNEANNSVESFDSKKMMTVGANQLYSTVAGQKFAMNGLQAQQNITRSVPLTIETIESKEYTLKASQIHFPQGQVYIEDKARQIMQNLSGNAEYTFDATAGTDADRFVLHFEANNGLSIAEATKDNISITADMVGNVTVKLDENATVDGTITIVDAAGRVISINAISSSTTKLNVVGVSGLYFVRVSNAGTVATEKIIIAQ